MPLSPPVELLNYGRDLLEQGDIEGALSVLDQAVGRMPNRPEAHFLFACALERAGRIEGAREAYNRVLQLDPSHKKALAGVSHLPAAPPVRPHFPKGRRLQSEICPREYTVLEVKQGGFGVVYIVDNQGTKFALKSMHSSLISSDDARRAFEREAITWVMMDGHPNIVRPYLLERIEGIPHILLEYVDGGDLGELLQQGPLSLQDALPLAIQFCDTMAFIARRYNLVHRDIKPANCLLTCSMVLKITDFGLARAYHAVRSLQLGLADLQLSPSNPYTTPAGTPPYMSPEQCCRDTILDARADIYSFGIMLYEMVTGERPGYGPAARELVDATSHQHNLPRDFVSLIRACVDPRVDARPESFLQVLTELTRLPESTRRPTPARPAMSLPVAAEWNVKGLALEALGYFQDAERCYRRGLDLDPAAPCLLNNLGSVMMKLGRPQEAIHSFDRCLELNPNEAAHWGNRAKALGMLGRDDDALSSFDEGLQRAPRDPVLLGNKASTLARLGRLDDALEAVSLALEISPGDGTFWATKASILLDRKRLDEALACSEIAIEAASRSDLAWCVRGQCLAAAGAPADALVCLQRAVEIAPKTADYWQIEARLLREVGRTAEAPEVSREAAKLRALKEAQTTPIWPRRTSGG